MWIPGSKHRYGWMTNGGLSMGTLGGITPVWRALGNGSTTPEIGGSGIAFARAASQLYPTGLGAVSTASSGSACIGAKAPTLNTSMSGIYISGQPKNNLLRSSAFNAAAWTVNGTGSTVANNQTSPDGTSNADELIGGASGDGIQQDSGLAAGSKSMYFGVWLKSSSGTRSVDIIIKDQAGSPASNTTTCSVTTTWKQFAVAKTFAAATGNIVCEIKVNNTTGYNIYAYQSSLIGLNNVGTEDSAIDFDLFPMSDTIAAVTSQTMDILTYTASELVQSRTIWSWNVWAYVPNFTDGQVWADKFIFANYNNSTGIRQGAKISSTNAKLFVSHGNNSFVDMAVALNKGAWNMITICADHDAPSYQTYLNGTLVFNNTVITRNASATDGLVVGADRLAPAPAQQNLMWDSIIGQMELYSTRLVQADVTSIYTSQSPSYS